jgi:lambda family phage minor tail protein L
MAETRDSVAVGFQPGPIVTLYDLDLSTIGVSQILHFTGGGNGSSVVPVTFQGVAYTPVELKTSGWSASGTGPFPQPQLQVSNVNDLFSGLVRQYQDLIGARLTRKRLFRSFLDDGTNGGQGTAALFSVDVYFLYQKTSHNKMYVQWKLASSLDQQGQQIPARQVTRDWCGFQYRTWNAATLAFDYTHVDCPYTGPRFYDETDAQVGDGASDACSKKVSGCGPRFAGTGYLPIGSYPGAGMGSI